VDTGFVVPAGGEAAAAAAKRAHRAHRSAGGHRRGGAFFCTDGAALTGEEIVVDGGIVKLGARGHRRKSDVGKVA
jgi:hypothetical protein